MQILLKATPQYITQLSVDTALQLVLPVGDDPNNLVPVQLEFRSPCVFRRGLVLSEIWG